MKCERWRQQWKVLKISSKYELFVRSCKSFLVAFPLLKIQSNFGTPLKLVVVFTTFVTTVSSPCANDNINSFSKLKQISKRAMMHTTSRKLAFCHMDLTLLGYIKPRLKIWYF